MLNTQSEESIAAIKAYQWSACNRRRAFIKKGRRFRRRPL